MRWALSGHDRVDVPPDVAEHYAEYRYCKDIKPGLSHEQYLSEPAETVAWLLQIDAMVAEVRAQKRRP